MRVPGDRLLWMSLSCWRRIFRNIKCLLKAVLGRNVWSSRRLFRISRSIFAALAQALNARTKAIVINSPNNPSGAVYSEQTIRRLAGLLAEKGGAIRTSDLSGVG